MNYELMVKRLSCRAIKISSSQKSPRNSFWRKRRIQGRRFQLCQKGSFLTCVRTLSMRPFVEKTKSIGTWANGQKLQKGQLTFSCRYGSFICFTVLIMSLTANTSNVSGPEPTKTKTCQVHTNSVHNSSHWPHQRSETQNHWWQSGNCHWWTKKHTKVKRHPT